jgi:hypothetical protein
MFLSFHQFFLALNHVNQVHVLSLSLLKSILILSFPAHPVPLSGLSRSGFPATTLIHVLSYNKTKQMH